jgi:hypothetical protein
MTGQTTNSPNAAELSDAKRDLLVKLLRGELKRSSPGAGAIARRSGAGPAPLTVSQETLWLRELEVPGIPPLYNECVTLRMIGPLDADALERSFNEVVRRHEIWRTTFETAAGQPVQVVHPDVSFRIPLVDLRGGSEYQREPEAVRHIKELTTPPFDMKFGPLLRPALVRMSDTEHRLYLVAHQIVLDGMSAYQIFPSELAAIYKAFCSGKPSPLPELPVQCGDFAEWQRNWLQGEVLAKEVDYWRNQLSGEPPALEWPTDKPRPAKRNFRGTIQAFHLPIAFTRDLKQFSQREGATLFMVLVAGITVLLHGYTAQEDISIGTLSPAGRKRSEVLGLLGYFLNPVALRFCLRPEAAFRDVLNQVRRVISEAISHDDVPIEFLARELRPQFDPSRSPFFTVAASLQPTTPDVGLDWRVTSMDVESGGASWDLYSAFIDSPSGLMVRAQYNPDLFEPSTIHRFIEDLQALLESAAANSLQPVENFSRLLRSGSRDQQEERTSS